MFKSLTPNLIADNVKASVDFYTNVLGFELVNSVPSGDSLVWAQVSSGNISVMLQERGSIEGELPQLKGFPTGASQTLFIMMDGIHDYFNLIRDKVRIIKTMDRSFYNHDEFTIADCDGYLLTFSQEVDS